MESETEDCRNGYLRDKCTDQDSEDIQRAVQDYLESVVHQEDYCDPKIRRQHQHLKELLDSYKKLCDRLDSDVKEKDRFLTFRPVEVNPKRPEIYALLHPELYRDIRQEEKDKLIKKFSSKRLFTDVERVLPPPTVTPTYTINDIRQREKERFVRLVSSAPSRFHNTIDGTPKIKPKKFIAYTPQRTENVRECEKERLARIFATSAAFLKKPNVQKKVLRKNLLKNFTNEVSDKNEFNHAHVKNDDIDGCQNKNEDHVQNYPLRRKSNEMVRMGEYSPLNNNHGNAQRGRTVLGVGEHDEIKRVLDAERHSEFVNHMAQSKIDKAVMVKERNIDTRVSSASTQTDDSVIDENEMPRILSSPHLSPKKQPTVTFSPRQKLISDLYGTPFVNEHRSINYMESVQEERRKQTEYAEALRQQIEEKKRIDDDRKRREREDEQLIDKMVEEQSKRLEMEYEREQNQKLDWIQQRQAQEEVLRRKLIEMSLETKELKRQEKLRRVNNERRIYVPPPKQPQKQYNHKPVITKPQEIVNIGLRNYEERPVTLIKENPNTLPEHLPYPMWVESPEKYTENLQGVDLLREYRNEKEKLQLPPMEQFHALPIEKGGPSAEDILRAPLDGYVPSVASGEPRRSKVNSPAHMDRRSNVNSPAHMDRMSKVYSPAHMNRSKVNSPAHTNRTKVNSPLQRIKSVNSARRAAEELLKIPIDNEIRHSISPQQSPIDRPPSPVVPAVKSKSVLRQNSKILDNKWKVPPPRGAELDRTVNHENILSQLGAFRLQLAREHQRLERRLEHRS